MALDQLLKRKVFGLPMPVVIVAGAGVAYYLYTSSGSATVDDTGDVGTTTDQPVDTTDELGAGVSGSAFAPGPGSVTYKTVNVTRSPHHRRKKHKGGGHRGIFDPPHGGRKGPHHRGGGRQRGRIGTTAARSIAARR